MAEIYYARPLAVTDERMRDAMEKQQRQRELREQLDSQRAAQREARAKAGLPENNEPMTRAQRHRQRLLQEQAEAMGGAAPTSSLDFGGRGAQLPQHLAGPSAAQAGAFGAPVGLGQPAWPVSNGPPQAEVLNGTFGRHANGYGPPAGPPSGYHSPATLAPGAMAVVRSSGGAPSLPPIAAGSPRFSPPQQPVGRAVAEHDETIYGWGATNTPPFQHHPPTPPQAPNAAYHRAQPEVAQNMPQRLAGTLSRAMPPNATQEELAMWLAQATEEIRRARAAEHPQEEGEVREQPRGRGPATRGARLARENAEMERNHKLPVQQQQAPQLPQQQQQQQPAQVRAPSSNAKQRTASTPKGAPGNAKVAKLEAALADQHEQMRRMREQQQEWQSQVDKLRGELKNARQKEKQLSKAVMDKKTATSKRAETAPKPAVSGGANGARDSKKDRRPITAGVELDPLDDAQKNRSHRALPALPEQLRNASKGVLATPRASPIEHAPDHRPPPPTHHQTQAVVEPPKAHGKPKKQVSPVAVPVPVPAPPPHEEPEDEEPIAELSFAQLHSLAENDVLTHRQVQRLWEVLGGTSSRRANINLSAAAPVAGAEDAFDAVETFETYEDLADDDEDD